MEGAQGVFFKVSTPAPRLPDEDTLGSGGCDVHLWRRLDLDTGTPACLSFVRMNP